MGGAANRPGGRGIPQVTLISKGLGPVAGNWQGRAYGELKHLSPYIVIQLATYIYT